MKELEDILKTKSEMPLAKKTVLNISYTSTTIKDSMLHVLKPFDISIEQFNVLRILRGQHGKPTNLQDIQDRMVSKMSNTTRLVDKLILKGFVERFICEKNRRKVDIFITEKGLKALLEIDPVIEKTEAHIASPLTQEELQTLNHLLTKLRD
ncbi:MarR family winged helix-turn-helix transcriptional regulator [Gelidibacter algens]|nr:MarR family transcriptional regulator [Gelidibacter algens]OBX27211.1 MarR family transcriptional regulator [Gelidibacter algens]